MKQHNYRWIGAFVMFGLAMLGLSAGAAPELRIGVRETGMHFVSASEIGLELGLSYSDAKALILSSGVSLSTNGSSVACYVDPAGEGIYFYGQAVDSAYTDENAYRLSWGSTADYMKTLAVTASAAVTNEAYSVSRHYEQDNFAAAGFVREPGADLYFWTFMYADAPGSDVATFAFDADKVSAVATNAQIALEVFSYGSEGVAGEHHIVVSLNGTQIGETWWDGVEVIRPAYSFDQSVLREGSNDMQVTALAGAGATWIGLHFRSFDLTYARTYEVVKAGQLVFSAKPGQPVAVTGLATGAVKVVELGFKDDPRLLSGVAVSWTGTAYEVYFDAPAGITDYAVFTEGNGLAASSITPVGEESLRQYGGAEYIIVTHPDLAASAQQLADYRASRHLSCKVVFVDDIYNEFSHGVAAPSAIRDFLSYAYENWARKPKYVLLAGAGSYDYKNSQGTGECLVPPVLQYIERGLYCTDSWYTDFDEDGVCELPVGRLPVLTNGEFSNYVARVSAYEATQGEAWHSTIVLASDDPDHGGEFYQSSDGVGAVIPESFATNKIYLTQATREQAHSNMVEAINGGALLVNYFGHGGVDFIAENTAPHLLAAGDVPSLTNAGKPAIVTGMSCVIGRFEIPGYASLGESLVMATNGGSIAVWAPSGLAFNEFSSVLAQDFYRSVLQDETKVLGDAVTAAQAAYASRNVDTRVLKVYNLLGEPVLLVPGVGAAQDDPYALPIPELDAWRRSNFNTSELENVAMVGDYEDPDGDKLPNLVEYAFGRNPRAADTEALFGLLSRADLEVSVPYDIVLKFKRRKGLSGIHINPLFSSDLISWTDAAGSIGHTRVVDDGNGQTETVELYVDCPDYYESWFFRMQVGREH